MKLDIPPPTEEELKEHYSRLAKTKGRPVLLSLVPGLNDSFIPKYVSGLLPKPLTHLYDEDALSLPFPDLLKNVNKFMMKCLFLLNKQRWFSRKHESSQTVRFGMINNLVELQLLDYIASYTRGNLNHLYHF